MFILNMKDCHFFCFYCGRLGHNDSFCEAKMVAGVEIVEMGWDLSLRARSRKALAMKSVWLREEGEEEWGGSRVGRQIPRNTLGVVGKNAETKNNIDPVLGFNLKGRVYNSHQGGDNSFPVYLPTTIDHDLEDSVLIGEEGEDLTESEEVKSKVIRSKGVKEVNYLSVAATRHADRKQ